MNQLATTASVSPVSHLRQKKRSLFDAFTRLSTAKDEINKYLALDEIPIDKNPYIWWNEKKEKFPILSQLARKILAVRAASTPSERLFTDAGNLLTVKKTRIKPDLFSRVMFLKRNGHHFASIHPPAQQATINETTTIEV